MYIQKSPKRGYTEYLNLDEGIGKKALMDVGFLIMEEGDTFKFLEDKKEVSFIVFKGDLKFTMAGKEYEVHRKNPFDESTACALFSKNTECVITALGHSEIYVQKSLNDREFEAAYYSPEETHTWERGNEGELDGCIRRDVRTSFDYDNAPHSNMVLGEVINRPGKWSSYPPHSHPQPEVYFYYFEKEQGFGASWINGEVYEIRHLGLSVITELSHPVVAGPGYAVCYAWGIRHFDDKPWKKDRNDDEEHKWMLDNNAPYWGKGK